MATLVMGGLGAGLAAIASGGNPAAIALGFNVGAVVGGLLFSHPQQQQRGKVDDLHVTGSSYGQIIPSVYGAVRLGGNLIWAMPLKEHTSGGNAKGGQNVKSFTYTCSFAITVCRGPVAGIRRIWADDLLVYDSTATPKSTSHIRVPYLGTETQLPDSLMSSVLGAANTPAFRGQCYVVFEDFPLTNFGNRIPSFSFEMLVDPAVTLHAYDILNDLATQCGMTIGTDTDFSAFTDVVTGFAITQRSQAYSLCEQLLQVYACDMAEIDGKLVAVKRGQTSIGHITSVDLGAIDWSSNNSEPPPTIETSRKSDLSLPFKYDVSYASIERLYGLGLQSAIRHSRQAIQDSKTLTTQLTLHDTDARQIADRLLDTEWLERVSIRVSLSIRWLLLAAASPITIDVNGVPIRFRVASIDIAPMGLIAVTLVVDMSIIYLNQVSLGGRVDSATNSMLSSVTSTLFDVYSGPEFTDTDALTPGFYVAMTGGTDWSGGTVYYSSNGVDWVIGPSVSSKADFGVTTTAIPSAPVGLDVTSSLGVQLTGGNIESTASSDLVAGVNASLVGGEWISYTDVAPGSGIDLFTLTNLMRGQKASPISSHAIGERFWYLNRTITRVSVPLSLIGTTVHVKVLSAGQSLSDVVQQDVVIHANVPPYGIPSDLGVIPVALMNGEIDEPTILYDDGIMMTSEG